MKSCFLRDALRVAFKSLEKRLLLDPRSSTKWIEADASHQLSINDTSTDSGLAILSQGRLQVFPFIKRSPKDAQWLALDSHGVPLHRGRPHEHLPLIRRIKALARTVLRRIFPSHSLIPVGYRCAVIGGDEPDAANYFHFIADTLGDLCFIQGLGISLNSIDLFIVPYANKSWQIELLSMIGIDNTRILPLYSQNDLVTNELIVPIRQRGSRSVPFWLPEAVRTLTGFQVEATCNPGSLRLYLSRCDSSRRVIENEFRIEQLLVPYGFKIVRCSDLSVKQQQELFSNATLIVAPHGAALTNLIWATPGGRLLELTYSSHHRSCFRQIAEFVGWEYKQLPLSQGIYQTKEDLFNTRVSTIALDSIMHYVLD